MHSTLRHCDVVPSVRLDVDTSRKRAENQQLSRAVRDMLSSNPCTLALGPDPYVAQLIASFGFKPHDIVVQRAILPGARVTLIVVPTRIWKDRESKAELLDIRDIASSTHSRCILVPQKWLTAPVRAAFARRIAAAKGTPLLPGGAAKLTEYLSQRGSATLVQCARRLQDHADPIDTVLSLHALGLVVVDKRHPISERTSVVLPR